ncbi:hypothetical protein PspLS_02254 [Pyricularia sp. CBS 133598]|nr:hypothetical protein PspLS_02254 [Pyricularia sp. CBS 133598]
MSITDQRSTDGASSWDASAFATQHTVLATHPSTIKDGHNGPASGLVIGGLQNGRSGWNEKKLGCLRSDTRQTSLRMPLFSEDHA